MLLFAPGTVHLIVEEGYEKVKSKLYSSLISISNCPLIVNFP